MIINNFDTSTAIIPVSLNAYYDVHQAQQVKASNFKFYPHALKGIPTAIYTHEGAYTPSDRNELMRFESYSFTRDEMYTALLSLDSEENLDSAYMDLKGEHIHDLSIYDLFSFAQYYIADDDNFLSFLNDNLTANFDIISATGYVQGDYANIVVTKAVQTMLEIESGKPYAELKEDLKQQFHHMYWDTPIFAKLYVTKQNDGDKPILAEESDLTFYLSNPYQWEKSEIFECVQHFGISDAAKEYVLEFLKENAPVALDYGQDYP